ncbi:condensation domain-containing protein [Salinactinospora qingdaonensis]|uniref:Condensation domain-containing protein n=1 Tax=Salinactinospora qingdaonensis TaxID=702744 RepID=A0ABP7FXY7_9ACTN
MNATDTPHAPNAPEHEVELSFSQEFLCMFAGEGEVGPFGPMYHVVRGWRLHGEVDIDTLRAALGDVVTHHEALRTSIVREGGGGYQRILPPSPPDLLVRDLDGAPENREEQVEEFLNEVESFQHSVRDIPLLRAALGRFDDRDAVLALLVHHTVADGWSLLLIMRDLAACYAARRGYGGPDLPEMRQYREYAKWQRDTVTEETTAGPREYWRAKLQGAQMLPLPTDRAEPDTALGSTATHRFLIDPELTAATLRFAVAARSSPFMVLLAAYNLLLWKRTGTPDVVVPTISSGRGDARFENTVGPFFNFIPLRTDLTECQTLRDVVLRSRSTCLEAQTNDIPFAKILAEAPDIMAPAAQPGVAVSAIQVFQHPFTMEAETVGDVQYSEVRKRLLSQSVSSDIPNGVLWTLDIDSSQGMFGNIKFNKGEYDDSTIGEMVEQFREILRTLVTDPDASIKEV